MTCWRKSHEKLNVVEVIEVDDERMFCLHNRCWFLMAATLLRY